MLEPLIGILVFFLGWFFILQLIEAHKKRTKIDKKSQSPEKQTVSSLKLKD